MLKTGQLLCDKTKHWQYWFRLFSVILLMVSSVTLGSFLAPSLHDRSKCWTLSGLSPASLPSLILTSSHLTSRISKPP